MGLFTLHCWCLGPKSLLLFFILMLSSHVYSFFLQCKLPVCSCSFFVFFVALLPHFLSFIPFFLVSACFFSLVHLGSRWRSSRPWIHLSLLPPVLLPVDIVGCSHNNSRCCCVGRFLLLFCFRPLLVGSGVSGYRDFFPCGWTVWFLRTPDFSDDEFVLVCVLVF